MITGVPDEALKGGDYVAMGVLVATFVEILPTVATILTIIWFLLRIYEMDTTKRILRYFFGKRG